MKKINKNLSSFAGCCMMFMLLFVAGTAHAQLVTNGSFEISQTGVVDSTAGINDNTTVKGWIIQVAAGITPAPIYEIVSDTVEQGNRALKITVHGLGVNQWDIQAIADSITVKPGKTYNYSVWAKASKAGATTNFAVGSYNFAVEYKAIRPATLGTQWQNYTMQFTVDTSHVIRAPIHFYGAVDTGNSIYIDNLQIVDDSIVNASKKPVIVEAEWGNVGSNYSVLNDGNITYVTPKTNWTSLTNPGDSSRTNTYHVTFADSGSYNLFARVRVGSGGYNDDSFFYGHGFGIKNDTSSTDWYMVNGLAGAGFTDPATYVDGPGSLGNSVWKWINITKNTFNSKGDSFFVSMDSLTKTFQVGSREDGLDIDKFAFGKTYLYFTVRNLDSVQAGSTTMQTTPVDSSLVWKGPALAAGQAKFLGNVPYEPPENTFTNYWTQLTPGNAGKWVSVAGSAADTSTWNWKTLDAQYNYAMTNHLLYKHHTLIWGAQQPSWISGLDSASQYNWIETWIKKVGQRYPKIDMVDVVNEPLPGHNPPDGGGSPARANYIKALGGGGTTGWDWVINSFKLARKYMPATTKLLINDYGIINDDAATTTYLTIINLLKQQGLIDGIGVQGHRFELGGGDTTTYKRNLTKLGTTGLPVYISEFDLGNTDDTGTADDNFQLQQYKKIFPPLWNHPAVKGITLWGYTEGQMWLPTCYLVHVNGTVRPAFTWLAQFVKDNPTGVEIINSGAPSAYQLEQNFPNPFNPVTMIRYSISKTTNVSLKVFDVLGREVQTLVNTMQAPGRYTVTLNAQGLGSGVYFYRLSAGSFSETKKLMLLK